MDERQTIIWKDNQCWHERRRNEGKILTFRGLSGCKAMPGWQGGFVGSKKFLSRLGWKSLDGCGVNQANRFTATFGFSQVDATAQL